MDRPQREARTLLLAIRSELRRLDLWETGTPPAEALESSAPFCFDSLDFHQWLQWVFIPRTDALLDAGESLPGRSDIAPMAEWYCQENGLDGERLIELLRSFDHLWR